MISLKLLIKYFSLKIMIKIWYIPNEIQDCKNFLLNLINPTENMRIILNKKSLPQANL
jgi:hypothetical protein